MVPRESFRRKKSGQSHQKKRAMLLIKRTVWNVGNNIVSPIKLQRKRTFEKLEACKWASFGHTSACFKNELWPFKRSIALQLYGTDYKKKGQLRTDRSPLMLFLCDYAGTKINFYNNWSLMRFVFTITCSILIVFTQLQKFKS